MFVHSDIKSVFESDFKSVFSEIGNGAEKNTSNEPPIGSVVMNPFD